MNRPGPKVRWGDAVGRTRFPFWLIATLVVLLLFFPLVLYVKFSFERWSEQQDETRYLSRIAPGMAFQDVRAVIPHRLISAIKKPCTNLYVGVYLANSNSLVASQVTFETESPHGTAEIYLDHEDRVVGVYYSASGRDWKPKWGKPITVSSLDVEQNIYKPLPVQSPGK